eukprot:6181351-Pleurochrysis_carterae.AAC.6
MREECARLRVRVPISTKARKCEHIRTRVRAQLLACICTCVKSRVGGMIEKRRKRSQNRGNRARGANGERNRLHVNRILCVRSDLLDRECRVERLLRREQARPRVLGRLWQQQLQLSRRPRIDRPHGVARAHALGERAAEQRLPARAHAQAVGLDAHA